MRRLVAPLVVARPGGARIRTRLPVSATDEWVLWVVAGILAGWPGRILRRVAASAQVPTSGPAASVA